MDTIFTSATGDGTAILRGESEPREGLAAFSSRGVPSFLSYFKTQSIGLAPGIELSTSLPAVKLSTDWANPTTVSNLNLKSQSLFQHGKNSSGFFWYNIQNTTT